MNGNDIRIIRSLYNRLSPENLACDGEASPAEQRREATRIWAALEVEFTRLGRRVSLEEAFGFSDSGGTIRAIMSMGRGRG